jgi:RNA polymerase sigma-70 factor (ECF subfamily)
MNRLEVFNQYRPLLFAIAYRMLSSVADAEDIVQEAWLRWQTAESVVQFPKAYLSKLVVRLCIDYLRLAHVRREQYIGSWLPEPLVGQQPNPIENAELAESLSFAFLILLECLSPTERAVFLLREVFDYDYTDISKIVNKTLPNCRQIVHRARQHLTLAKHKDDVPCQQKQEIITQFLASWNEGDMRGLIALMAEDVTFWADGGGEVVAARKPLQGNLKIARFLIAIRSSRLLPRFTSQITRVNSQYGIINYMYDKPQSVLSFELRDDEIKTIFAVVNPVKLQHIQ